MVSVHECVGRDTQLSRYNVAHPENSPVNIFFRHEVAMRDRDGVDRSGKCAAGCAEDWWKGGWSTSIGAGKESRSGETCNEAGLNFETGAGLRARPSIATPAFVLHWFNVIATILCTF